MEFKIRFSTERATELLIEACLEHLEQKQKGQVCSPRDPRNFNVLLLNRQQYRDLLRWGSKYQPSMLRDILADAPPKLFKTGRAVSKSTTLAAQGLLQAMLR